ncbi:MAG: hypothetical protein IIW98_05395, partial [Bacteroidaceae bacterium]|nr:hypothetical protein [Bacteroidaceae bacterium]
STSLPLMSLLCQSKLDSCSLFSSCIAHILSAKSVQKAHHLRRFFTVVPMALAPLPHRSDDAGMRKPLYDRFLFSL